MILSKPVQPSSHRTHISYPMLSQPAPRAASPQLLASPPTTPPRSHTSKHSLSKPMSWLNRSSSSASNRYGPRAAPKPTRISEPKMGSSLDQLGLHRSGPLGSGATIVRTPQEALSGSAHRHNRSSEEDGAKRDTSPHDTEKNESKVAQRPPSPPLPPLPDVPGTEGGNRMSGNPESVASSDHILPPRSSGSASPPAQFSSSRPTLVAHPRTSSRSTPSLPADTDLTPLPSQPPFEAILLSPIPEGAIDPSKLIVTLETCTTTYRILLRSLVSRPSHLSRYITFMLSPASETASVYSNASDVSLAHHSNGFSTFFRDHLASSGCLPQSTGIHVFLDRPSAPYTHVLAYLRSLPSTLEHPETLPRAVQLGSTSSHLESLLEVRDEANYLGLTELEKLCSHEIRRFQHATLPASTGGMHRGQTGSVRSFHTVVERYPSRQDGASRPSDLRVSKGNSISCRTPKTASRESSQGSSLENRDTLVRERGRQGGTKHEVGLPLPGWI